MINDFLSHRGICILYHLRFVICNLTAIWKTTCFSNNNYQKLIRFLFHSHSPANNIPRFNTYFSIQHIMQCLFFVSGSCNSNQILCKNGKCTNSSNVCNYNNDCGDNSDEFGCRKCVLQNILHEKEVAQMKHALVTIGGLK